jgi:hypothetical protein
MKVCYVTAHVGKLFILCACVCACGEQLLPAKVKIDLCVTILNILHDIGTWKVQSSMSLANRCYLLTLP